MAVGHWHWRMHAFHILDSGAYQTEWWNSLRHDRQDGWTRVQIGQANQTALAMNHLIGAYQASPIGWGMN